MNPRTYLLLLLVILIYLSMPLGAAAQSLETISGPTHAKSSDTLTFVVEARDGDGNLEPEVEVRFGISPSDDTAELGTYRATTSTDGRAKITLILKDNAGGLYRISVWRDDDVRITAIFTVEIDTALPPKSITETLTTTTTPFPEPPTLSIVSGDGQEGVAGTVLADPFVVELRRENGKPLRRIAVTFTITAGRGAMSVVTSTTDGDGRVASVMTLSPEPGINRVQVSVEELDQIVTFSAQGIALPPEPMPDEEEIIPPVAEPMPSLEFDLSLPAGLNLIHIPLKVRTIDGTPATIQSVADLYAVLGGADILNWLITHDSVAQQWHVYFGDADRGSIADRALTDQTGILASTKTPISVRLAGDALGMDGTSTITLTSGLNLVGLPLNDPSLTRVSDLLILEGISGNLATIVVTDNGEFKLVRRADDAGDIPITGGGAFILIAQGAATIPITGTGWKNAP